jgi:hypothetical protein
MTSQASVDRHFALKVTGPLFDDILVRAVGVNLGSSVGSTGGLLHAAKSHARFAVPRDAIVVLRLDPAQMVTPSV